MGHDRLGREFNLFYDRKGKPLRDVLEWGRLLENDKYRRLLETVLPNGTLVSTVWLGIDHSFGGGPPVIFETMAFAPRGRNPDPEPTGNAALDRLRVRFKDAPEDLDCQRYSTEDDAIVGHWKMVERWTPQDAKRKSNGAQKHARIKTRPDES